MRLKLVKYLFVLLLFVASTGCHILKPKCPITTCKIRTVHTHAVILRTPTDKEIKEKYEEYYASIAADSTAAEETEASEGAGSNEEVAEEEEETSPEEDTTEEVAEVEETPEEDTEEPAPEPKKKKKKKKNQEEENTTVDEHFGDGGEDSKEATSELGFGDPDGKKKKKPKKGKKGKKGKNSGFGGEQGNKIKWYRSRVTPIWKNQNPKIGEDWKKPKEK